MIATLLLLLPLTSNAITQDSGKDVASCMACHGATRADQITKGFPRLAGLNAIYLLKQLNDFANGTRNNPVMTPIAIALSTDERQRLAEHYSQLPPPMALTTSSGGSSISANSVGAILATRGRWSANIPACEQCHGPGGIGVGVHFPPLAGQPAKYLAGQLKAWKQGKRRNDPLALMAHIAKKLNSADIDAVANWFAAQSASSQNKTPGSSWHIDKIATPHSAANSAHIKSDKFSFTPPPESAIPNNKFGAMVRRGRDIFRYTRYHASAYVGNALSCENCHLDAGRLANSAPLWGAYGMYPQYRAKNKHVNTFIERLQGCFLYSMNGKVPPADSPVLIALDAYAYWMSKGAPVGVKLEGAGYPKHFKPPRPANYARGQQVFNAKCAICHGDDGQGQQVNGEYVFPPLWGRNSYNWGAGMHQLNNAAGFIKANMPLGLGNSLSNQEAWDVAMFINAHERPQDPRYTGDLAETRRQYHNSPYSLYGTEINGHLLGSAPTEP